LRVSAQPFTSFGLSLLVLARPDTRQITRIVIHDVDVLSDAAENGISPGDEITRIEGRSIYSFVADFDRGSDFGHYFIARKAGDQITLDVSTKSGTQRHLTLTEGLTNRSFDWRH
jgi:S1-C subfamily serine protease